MYKVNNRRCIASISRKSMLANRKRCVVLLTAIALTTMMLTSLFTIGGSLVKSMEMSTMYQVGTSYHGGFKFLTREEYDIVAKDPEIRDLSYNILVGDVVNEEVYEDYTELRCTTEANARASFSLPTQGRLPEKEDEIAACTKVLDDFGIPHEIGQHLHLKVNNGFENYEGDFTVCGIWEKPAETMANQIFVSEAFQERFSPVWKNTEDKERVEAAGSFAGSINPGFNFRSALDLSGQIDALKERCGFGMDQNEGVNWAYSASSVDFSSAAIAISLLVLIILSGYLIIYNIFCIAVAADIHYYGLLKTIGTTNRQLKQIVVRQGSLLSLIAIPAGLLSGYLISVVLLPIITESILDIPCRLYPNIWIFLLSAAFSWLTVRISCIRPCRIIRKISPVEAVNYSDYTVRTRMKSRSGHRVTPLTMAWENLKRSRIRNAVVILSIALSLIMLNVTVGIVASFDENAYIRSQTCSDFMVTDGAIAGKNYQEQVFDAVSQEDIDTFRRLEGVTELGCIYFSESDQPLEGESLSRARKEFEEHPDWFINSERLRERFRQNLYDDCSVSSHIYGIDKLYFDNMEVDDGTMDWDQFQSGGYVIVSSPVEGLKNDAEQAFYQIGETIPVTFPDGRIREYKVMAIGDVPYAMGPEHSHGLDINITLPENEYLTCIPDAEGAMKCSFNAEDTMLDTIDGEVRDYCVNIRPKLGYTSRQVFLENFKSMIRMFLMVGGILSFIIALIGIMNFINLTYTSIHERKKELATLRAVGMTRKQIEGMLISEGLIRIALTFLFVLTIGMIVNYELIHLIAGQMMMFRYRFVIWPVLVAVPVLSTIAVIVSKLVIRQTGSNI